MKSKLITDVSTEPITLSEVKNHLKIDSNSFDENITTHQSIVPFDHAIGGVTGDGVDVLATNAIVNINAGQFGSGGTVDVKIQDSDDDSTYYDWYSFGQISESNDNQVHEKQYTGDKQYIRCVATVANAACYFSCDIIVENAYSEEDTMLTNWIKSAREFGEDYTKIAFATQTWDMFLNDFPRSSDRINWFFAPLQSITSVKYKDEDGDETTLTEGTHYIVDISDPLKGGIFLPYGESWESFIPYPYNAVTIRGVCGYTGTVPYKLPNNFKSAMLIHVGYMYKFRDEEIPAKELQTVYNLYNMRRMNWV